MIFVIEQIPSPYNPYPPNEQMNSFFPFLLNNTISKQSKYSVSHKYKDISMKYLFGSHGKGSIQKYSASSAWFALILYKISGEGISEKQTKIQSAPTNLGQT